MHYNFVAKINPFFCAAIAYITQHRFMLTFSAFETSQQKIVSLIQSGGVLIFPTETIYGIGCSALQEESIRRVFEIKGRKPDQPPPVLVANDKQLMTLVASVPAFAAELMHEFWPGSLTLILPARDDVSSLLCSETNEGSTRAVGVRMTGHTTARAMCEESAPLIATSANFSGASGRAAAPQEMNDIPSDFKIMVDAVIDGGVVGGVASTVVDCTGDAPRVLRPGAVTIAAS